MDAARAAALGSSKTNQLSDYAHVFDRIPQWRGSVPPGYTVDFLGTLIADDFLHDVKQLSGAEYPYPRAVDGITAQPRPPTLDDGGNADHWFEAVGWITAAHEARDRFVMVSLGAFFGYQAVASFRALQLLNPMPCKLVCVEPLAQKMAWVRRHMRDNGIDPERQWLIEAAIGANNDAVLFPVGAPTIGGHNCIATNEPAARNDQLRNLLMLGRAEQALTALLLRNSTGVTTELKPGRNFVAEIAFVSCITLSDVLGPFEFVDYIDADLQQSESVVFPPYMELLKRKVRRIHIGTHKPEVHGMLHRLFADQGWDIVFSYPPESTHDSPAGPFTTGDGVLTVRNLDL